MDARRSCASGCGWGRGPLVLVFSRIIAILTREFLVAFCGDFRYGVTDFEEISRIFFEIWAKKTKFRNEIWAPSARNSGQGQRVVRALVHAWALTSWIGVSVRDDGGQDR